MVLTIVAFGQRTITGTVSDETGETLIGVNVLEKGTSNGAATDIDGTYSITVSGDDAIIEISYTGMISREILVAGRSVIDVVLSENAEILDEVVVSALGFAQKKDETGSTSTIVEPENIKRSGEANLLNSLGAKASNVQINRANGDPGSGSTIRIRGANTIQGETSPLIILDGIPISNQAIYAGTSRFGGTSQQSRLNDINPNDIESVQVLKGASAAALWGSRAANGVLVITTKNGKAGRPKISYKSSLSFDEVNQKYELQNTYGQGRSGSYSPTGAESWGDYIPDRSGSADVFDTGGEYFESADGSLHYPIDEKNSRETFVDSNWDDVFETGGFWQNDLSISGGTDKSNYFFSMGRIDQDGIIKESFYDRTNVRLNNKFFFTDWLNMSSKASYTNTQSNRIEQSSNVGGLLLGLLRTPPDFDNRDYIGTYVSSTGAQFPNRHRSYRRYLANNFNPTYNNPAWTIYEQEGSNKVDRYIVSSEINILPTSNLQVTLRGGVDSYTDTRKYFFPISSAGSTRREGRFDEDILQNKEVNFDAIVRGNFQLSSDIGLVATAGWNFNDRRYQRNSTEISGFSVNSRKQSIDLNSANEASAISKYLSNRVTNRGYGTLSFDLYDQLYVNVGGAVEAASTANKTFFYPSADVAWQFTKMAGFKKDGPLNFGKLRFAWGRVGIAPPVHAAQTVSDGSFSYSTYSDPLDNTLFGSNFRLDPTLGNQNLEPEIKTEWEIGTDLRLFEEKLSLGMTYYSNKIDGIIIAQDFTPSFGYANQIANAGDMENSGFEIDATYTVLKNSDWNIDAYANWSTNDNLVTRLEGTETIDLSGGSVSSRAIAGYPLGTLYGTGSQTNADGSFILNDDGFPQLTPSPIILGNPLPDWRGGLGVNVNYKKVSLNVLFEHSSGGQFSPRTLHVLNRFGTTQETAGRVTLAQDLVNYAGNTIAAGTTVRGTVKDFGAGDVLLDESWYRTGIGGGFGDGQAYNFSIYDATFTRLRELTLGYTIDGKAFTEKTKLGSINISLSGRNLFLWDDIPGVDPEINQTGVGSGAGLDYFTNPSTRSYLVTISVNY